jgi:hypothetical protein
MENLFFARKNNRRTGFIPPPPYSQIVTELAHGTVFAVGRVVDNRRLRKSPERVAV